MFIVFFKFLILHIKRNKEKVIVFVALKITGLIWMFIVKASENSLAFTIFAISNPAQPSF